MLLNCIIDKGFISCSSDDLDLFELIESIIEKYNKGFIGKCFKKQTYNISNRKVAMKTMYANTGKNIEQYALKQNFFFFRDIHHNFPINL